MFDKKQKSRIKRIHLVTNHGLYDRKTFYKVEIVFIPPLWMMANLSITIFQISEKVRTNGPLPRKYKIFEKYKFYFK